MAEPATNPPPATTIGSVSARVDRRQLRQVLAAARTVIGARPLLPALSCFHLRVDDGALTMATTDLETTVAARLDCWPTRQRRHGEVLLNRRGLARDLNALPDAPTRLAWRDGQVDLDAGGAHIVHRHLAPLEDFPDLPTLDQPAGAATLNPDDVDLLRLAARVTSRDEGRPLLAAVQLAGATLLATDSYRAVRARLSTDLDTTALIPGHVAAGVAALARDTDLEVAADESRVRLSWRRHDIDWTVTTTQPEQNPPHFVYPSVGSLFDMALEQDGHQVELDRPPLLAAARRHRAFAGPPFGGGLPVVLARHRGRLKLTTASEEVGELTETLEQPWPKVEVAFNPGFLVELLATVPDEAPTAHVRDQIKPLVITSDQLDLMLMPMRTS